MYAAKPTRMSHRYPLFSGIPYPPAKCSLDATKPELAREFSKETPDHKALPDKLTDSDPEETKKKAKKVAAFLDMCTNGVHGQSERACGSNDSKAVSKEGCGSFYSLLGSLDGVLNDPQSKSASVLDAEGCCRTIYSVNDNSSGGDWAVKRSTAIKWSGLYKRAARRLFRGDRFHCGTGALMVKDAFTTIPVQAAPSGSQMGNPAESMQFLLGSMNAGTPAPAAGAGGAGLPPVQPGAATLNAGGQNSPSFNPIGMYGGISSDPSNITGNRALPRSEPDDIFNEWPVSI